MSQYTSTLKYRTVITGMNPHELIVSTTVDILLIIALIGLKCITITSESTSAQFSNLRLL